MAVPTVPDSDVEEYLAAILQLLKSRNGIL